MRLPLSSDIQNQILIGVNAEPAKMSGNELRDWRKHRAVDSIV
jgi:hypothetical protein